MDPPPLPNRHFPLFLSSPSCAQFQTHERDASVVMDVQESQSAQDKEGLCVFSPATIVRARDCKPADIRVLWGWWGAMSEWVGGCVHQRERLTHHWWRSSDKQLREVIG